MVSFRFGSRSLFLVLIAAALGACNAPVDLSAVQKYAATTAAAGPSFAALAADFPASCLRLIDARDFVVDATASSQTEALIGDPTTEELTDAATIHDSFDISPGYVFVASPTAPSPGTPTSSPTQVPTDDDCAGAAAVGVAWNKANTTVLAYVQALGNLANVDAIPTVNPGPLATPLKAAGVSPAASAASSAILGSIAKFYESQAVDREIKNFLSDVNPSMPGAIEALEVVDAAYSIQLQNEFLQIEKRYDAFASKELLEYAAIHGSSQGSVNRRLSIARSLLATKAAVMSALTFVNGQRQASLAYGSAMEQILKTHQELFAASQRKAAFADYVKIVETTGAPVVTDLTELAKAVK